MKLKTLGLIAAIALFGAAVAFASDAASDDGQSPGVNLVYRLLNIVLFIGILYKLLGKRVKDFFVGRREGIRAELESLDARRAEAEQKLDDVKKSIANLAAEREAVLAESRAQAERIKAAILEEAERQAAQIREQALRAAENEGKAAAAELRAALADEITAAAEALLRSRLDDALHDKLIDNSLTKVVLN